jgi:hypothetical protein
MYTHIRIRWFAKFFPSHAKVKNFANRLTRICYLKWWFLCPLAHIHIKKAIFYMRICKFSILDLGLYATRKFFYGRASPSALPNWRLFVPTWKYSSPPPSGILLLTWRNPSGWPAKRGLTWRNPSGWPAQPGLTWRNPSGWPVQPGLIRFSVSPSVCE